MGWRPQKQWIFAQYTAAGVTLSGDPVRICRIRAIYRDYVYWLAQSGGWQEIDRIDNRHRHNIFLGAEVEVLNSSHDLLRKLRGMHI